MNSLSRLILILGLLSAAQAQEKWHPWLVQDSEDEMAMVDSYYEVHDPMAQSVPVTLLQVEMSQNAITQQNTLKAQNLLNCECQFTRVAKQQLLVEESAQTADEGSSQSVMEEDLKSMLKTQLKQEMEHQAELQEKEAQRHTQQDLVSVLNSLKSQIEDLKSKTNQPRGAFAQATQGQQQVVYTPYPAVQPQTNQYTVLPQLSYSPQLAQVTPQYYYSQQPAPVMTTPMQPQLIQTSPIPSPQNYLLALH